MAYQNEGVGGKLEITRGVANLVRYWPRVDGVLLTPSVTSLIEFVDPGLANITPIPVTSVGGDGSIQFTWTPPSNALLYEDYHFTVQYTDQNGEIHQDRVFFDVVKTPLQCPIDQNMLEQEEPNVSKYMTAAGATAQRFILAAWRDIIGRIRSKGHRPALVTDRHVFVEAAIKGALAEIFEWLIKKENDSFDTKAKKYRMEMEKAWNRIGPIKFEDILQSGAPTINPTLSQPKMKV